MYFRKKAVLCELQIVVASADRSEIVAASSARNAPGPTLQLQESGLNDAVPALRDLLRTNRGQQAS